MTEVCLLVFLLFARTAIGSAWMAAHPDTIQEQHPDHPTTCRKEACAIQKCIDETLRRTSARRSGGGAPIVDLKHCQAEIAAYEKCCSEHR